MTNVIQIHKIKQSWDIKEMQKAATTMVSEKIASRIHFLEKHNGEETEEMEKASAQLNAEKLIKSGVKTPLELVKYLAEYEVNMFGSQASFSGDDESAVLINEKSNVWLQTKHANHFSEKSVSAMMEHYISWMKHLGHKFGFKVEVEIAEDQNSSKATFSTR